MKILKENVTQSTLIQFVLVKNIWCLTFLIYLHHVFTNSHVIMVFILTSKGNEAILKIVYINEIIIFDMIESFGVV